jgi:hypothetical protein
VKIILSIFAFAAMMQSSLAFANLNPQRDLVALHYDHAPDRDDAHAAAASLAVVDAFQLQTTVVGGAYGLWNADRYVPESEAVMNAVWSTNWLDAHNRYDEAADASYDRWLQVLSAGADIWVAEGGQADFTADVLQRIQASLPAIDTRQRIHVVQHSDWNQVHADQSDLDYVRNNTNYILIEDGNFANTTADLNQRSQGFVDTVLSSRYASAWRAAFDYLDPNEKLDFSEVVELLYIVGVGVDEVATPDEFAARFIGDVESATTRAPGSALYWTDSYSVDGQCYCDTNFDHDLSRISVNTPIGSLPVTQVCADVQARFGEGRSDGRLYYNTVQCGHQPANSAADEVNCPGFLTDSTGSEQNFSCAATGARWNLDAVYAVITESPVNSGGNNTLSVCRTSSDPDGDGFGWEDGRSCRIDQISMDAERSPVIDTGADNLPACLGTDDPNGDGFRWENGRICQIQNASGDSGTGTTNPGADSVTSNPGTGTVIVVGTGSLSGLFIAGLLLPCVVRRRRQPG